MAPDGAIPTVGPLVSAERVAAEETPRLAPWSLAVVPARLSAAAVLRGVAFELISPDTWKTERSVWVAGALSERSRSSWLTCHRSPVAVAE